VVAGEDLDARDASRFKAAFATTDRDGDGRLTQSELDDWIGLREQIARGLVLLTLLDQGTGLFERLDADRDGALSARELRDAPKRIGDTGTPDLGAPPPARGLPPRRFNATLSSGHPLPATARAPRAGPPWFLAMDRNGDGDVSRREFVGPVAAFATLDSDGDGLIGPDEAARRPPGSGP
jgi:Ca2+-binding EF-hand superfamily protein